MAIVDSIHEAQKRGASSDAILVEIEKQNPAKKAVFDEARKRGASSDTMVAEIIKQNARPAIAPKEPGIVEKAARILSPKSVEGFGETLGTAAAVAGGVTKRIGEAQVQEADARLRLAQQLRVAGPEQAARIRAQLGQGPAVKEATEQLPALKKTGREIAAEAVGTGLAIATGASIVGKAPGAATALGRIAGGAAFGGGAGLEAGLKDETKRVGQVLASAGKGAAAGAVAAGAFEGVRKLVSFAGKTRAAQKFAGRRINRELQPPTKEIAGALERDGRTFGEKVVAVRDKTGRPIYQGNLGQLRDTATDDISTQGKELMKKVGKIKKTITTRAELKKMVLEQLDDEYGMLTSGHMGEKEMVAREAMRMPSVLNGRQTVLSKRIYDNKIPDSFWSKLKSGDRKTAIAIHARYLFRDGLRKLLNERSGDKAIQALNDRMSLGMDVRKLAALQMAKVELEKLPFSLTNLLGRILEGTIFRPAVTTRIAGAAAAPIRGAAPGAAATALRRAAELQAGKAAGQ